MVFAIGGGERGIFWRTSCHHLPLSPFILSVEMYKARVGEKLSHKEKALDRRREGIQS